MDGQWKVELKVILKWEGKVIANDRSEALDEAMAEARIEFGNDITFGEVTEAKDITDRSPLDDSFNRNVDDSYSKEKDK